MLFCDREGEECGAMLLGSCRESSFEVTVLGGGGDLQALAQ